MIVGDMYGRLSQTPMVCRFNFVYHAIKLLEDTDQVINHSISRSLRNVRNVNLPESMLQTEDDDHVQ